MRYPERQWQTRGVLSDLLLPAAWLYATGVVVRRAAYARGLIPRAHLPVPVVVVGNLSVGGTGKTPLVVWLARALASRGWHPGVLTRGYGGKAARWPIEVAASSAASQVGDEAVLLARRCGCPVVAGRRRAEAAALMLSRHACDVLVCDDGLQHYRLKRDVEIAVIDGIRRFGNGRCLPAGPLREPLARLEAVDLRLTQGEPAAGEWSFCLRPRGLKRVDGAGAIGAGPRGRVHAVAGIGHPERYFAMLRAQGFTVAPHPFADHHVFRAADLEFGDDDPVVMTEKDAVKCEAFARPNYWYLEVEAQPEPGVEPVLLQLLKEKRDGQKTA